MKIILAISALTFTTLINAPAFADDNIAACEIVLMAPVLSPEIDAEAEAETEADPATGGEEETLEAVFEAQPEPRPMIATFLPADKFVFSVFDNEPGHLSEVDGAPIRALMCTRTNVLPTEFDEKIIRTNISLHLSQNFDSPDSALLSIRTKDGKYDYEYAGPDLSAEDKTSLKSYLKRLNTQDEE